MSISTNMISDLRYEMFKIKLQKSENSRLTFKINVRYIKNLCFESTILSKQSIKCYTFFNFVSVFNLNTLI